MTSKQIDHYSKQIVDKLYSAYGTDSGIIFGIKDRKIVEGIVEFTLIQIEKEKAVFETNQGKMTGNQIVDHLTWCSYKAQRDYGISHERLMKIGLGTKEMDAKYNELKNPTNL